MRTIVGWTVFFAACSIPEPSNAKTITSPSATPVSIEPTQYPSIDRWGRGSSNITVVAASSVGFRADRNARPTTSPMRQPLSVALARVFLDLRPSRNRSHGSVRQAKPWCRLPG